MHHRKRILSILLMSGFLLAACESPQLPYPGDSKPTVTPKPPTPAASTPTEAELAEKIFCQPVEEEVSRADCRRYGNMVASLERGVAAFNPPKTMLRGHSAVVELSIAKGEDFTVVAEQVDESAAPAHTFKAKVGRYMMAELTGSGFKIDPAGPQPQDLFVSGNGYWQWRVTALKAPMHKLILKAWAQKRAPDGSLRQVWLKTVHREITVEVTLGQRVEDIRLDSMAWFERGNNWAKALAGLIGALGSVWVAIKLFGKADAKDGG